jgi:hypothetical protein
MLLHPVFRLFVGLRLGEQGNDETGNEHDAGKEIGSGN